MVVRRLTLPQTGLKGARLFLGQEAVEAEVRPKEAMAAQVGHGVVIPQEMVVRVVQAAGQILELQERAARMVAVEVEAEGLVILQQQVTVVTVALLAAVVGPLVAGLLHCQTLRVVTVREAKLEFIHGR